MVDVFGRHGVRFDPRAATCNRFVRYSDYAALEAQLAARTGGVKVKPLEWQENRFPRDKMCKRWLADTPFGTYWIEHKKKYWVSAAGKGQWHTYFDTLEAAKAAAQADFERRILSALEATPSATLEAQLAEAKAVMRAVYDWMNQLPIPTAGCTSKMQLLYDALSALEATPAPQLAETGKEPVEASDVRELAERLTDAANDPATLTGTSAIFRQTSRLLTEQAAEIERLREEKRLTAPMVTEAKQCTSAK